MSECFICHRPISASRGCSVHGKNLVRHVGCPRAGRSVAAHAVAFPDCPDGWHDLWDHPSIGVASGRQLENILATKGWEFFTDWLEAQQARRTPQPTPPPRRPTPRRL